MGATQAMTDVQKSLMSYGWEIDDERVVVVVERSLGEAADALRIAQDREYPDKVELRVQQARPVCVACSQDLNGDGDCSGCDEPWYSCDCNTR